MTDQPADQPDRDPKLLGVAHDDEHRVAQRRSADEAAGRRFAIESARLLHDLHFEDVLVLDLRGLWDVADFLVIATGSSQRQLRSMSGQLEDIAAPIGLSRFGKDVDDSRSWVVLDFVDVMIHLFEPETRAHYDLEMLWGDAPHVDWDRRDDDDSP